MSEQRSHQPAMCAAIAVALAASTACAVGPRYVRPDAPSSSAYREAPPPGWSVAQPEDAVTRGEWWRVFHEPALDALENKVAISNQNVLAAEAQYRAARAAVRSDRAGLVPEVTATPSVARAGGGASARDGALYQLPVGVSYEADVW